MRYGVIETTIQIPVIRYLVVPIHNNRGELIHNGIARMMNQMTKKLEEDQATKEVNRAINAWLYGE